MVQLTLATSIALVQLALLAQTSVALPIESGGMIESRALATSESQLSKRLFGKNNDQNNDQNDPNPHKGPWQRINDHIAKVFKGKNKKDPEQQAGGSNQSQTPKTDGDGATDPHGNPNGGDPGNPDNNLSERDWYNLEKRYWDDLELDARGYNDLDDLQLSRRDGWHLPWHRHDNDANEGQTNNPPPNGKRSLDDLEERDWDEFERRYWLD